MFLHRSLLIFGQIVYFCTMNENEIYYHVRIAVRDSKDPQAYPYIRPNQLLSLRKQGFRCLLSIREANPVIT